MKTVLKYIILALFILNLPGFIISEYGLGISSLLSYTSFSLLILYYFIYLKGAPNLWLIYIGLGYFLISGLNTYSSLSFSTYSIFVVKFMIIVIFGNSFFRSITQKEMTIFLLIGASSIIINATFFANQFGRYGGFYVNPNPGGFISILGYALSYSLSNKKLRLVSQIMFTVAGILTFSRTFILVWVIVNLISLRINIKNIRVFAIGIGLAILLLTFGELLKLDGLRFQQYQAVFTNKSSVKTLEKGSRTETWAKFYDAVYNNIFVGGGFGRYQGHGGTKLGPHNTYLLIILEAGILPLLIFIAFFCYMLIWSNKLFSLNPSLFMMTSILTLYLLTSHNYFNSYILVSATLFVHQKIEFYRTSATRKN